MQDKRAQAAMEFLMTYGWAILVVLAAIGALAYFGVLSPDRFLPNQCTIGQGFNCMEFKVDGTSEVVKMRIRNNLGTDVSEANVTLNGTGRNSDFDVNRSWGPTSNGADLGGSDVKDYDGGTINGDQFRGDITIVYQRSGDTVSHTTTGTIVSDVE